MAGPNGSEGPQQETITMREALQSIAVELHRGNLIAQQAMGLQQQAVDLARNTLDLMRGAQTSATSQVDAGMSNLVALLQPIQQLIAEAASPAPKAAQIATSEPVKPIVKEGEGTRVESTPEE